MALRVRWPPEAVRAQPFPGTFSTLANQEWPNAACRSPTSYGDTLQKPGHRAGSSPLPPLHSSSCFPSRDCTRSTQDSPLPPSPLPAAFRLCCPPLAYLGSARDSVRGPRPGFCHMWPLSNRNLTLVQMSRDAVSVPHAFVSSSAAAERASGGGASVIHSTFLPASPRAAWEIQWGCPLLLPEPILLLPLSPPPEPASLPHSLPQKGCSVLLQVALPLLFTLTPSSLQSQQSILQPSPHMSLGHLSHVRFLDKHAFFLPGRRDQEFGLCTHLSSSSTHRLLQRCCLSRGVPRIF